MSEDFIGGWIFGFGVGFSALLIARVLAEFCS